MSSTKESKKEMDFKLNELINLPGFPVYLKSKVRKLLDNTITEDGINSAEKFCQSFNKKIEKKIEKGHFKPKKKKK